jgi:hypothetical protein
MGMLLSAGRTTWLVVLLMLVSGPVVVVQTASMTPRQAAVTSGRQAGTSTAGPQGRTSGSQPGAPAGRTGAPAAGRPGTSTAGAAAGGQSLESLADAVPLPSVVAHGDQGTGSMGSNSTNELIGSLFAGSTFGAATTSSSPDFGATLSFMHNGIVGGELLVGYVPHLMLAKLGGTSSSVATYMFNALAALPLGSRRLWRPFISGGFGGITLHTADNNALIENAGGAAGPGNQFTSVSPAPEAHVGFDLGGGLLAFARRWGVRADLRYFDVHAAMQPSASDFVVSTTGTAPTPALIAASTGTSFWRGNVGIAIRW